VFWLRLTASGHAQADIDNVVAAVLAAFQTRFKPHMANGCSINTAKASWLYASGSVLDSTSTNSVAGTGGAGPSVDSICAVIDWAIGSYYRGGHPRSYLALPPASVIVNGRLLNGTFQGNLATDAQGFISDVNALTHGTISAVELGTVRFASANAWLSPPVFKPYSTATVRGIVGTQRRRLAA
jgi:hypothetical protein